MSYQLPATCCQLSAARYDLQAASCQLPAASRQVAVIHAAANSVIENMQGFRNLHVWRKAHEFVLSAYRVTAAFPGEERFALTTQIRRAAMSIPANVAEGCGRGSDADFARFLQMAIGSANELEYHLLLACDLDFISKTEHQSLSKQLIEIRRMLMSLVQRLRAGQSQLVTHSS